MNKTNNTYSTGKDIPNRATQAEIPEAIEALQKETSRLTEEASVLMGQLSPVMNHDTAEPACDEACKQLARAGLLQPLDELKSSIANTADLLHNIRLRLMI